MKQWYTQCTLYSTSSIMSIIGIFTCLIIFIFFSIFRDITTQLQHIGERGGARSSHRENNCWRSYFYLWVLLLPLVLILSLRKLRGSLLYGFPKENICVYCLLRLIAVHVILSDMNLRPYCLNDKNLTMNAAIEHNMVNI